ncbi:MAG: DUF6541 family protein [Nitrososphaerales archaeon]
MGALPDPLLISLQLVLFMTLLAIIGRPLWFILSKIFSISSNNLLQELVLSVCSGGLVLYLLALLPFHLFNLPVLLILVIVCFIFTIGPIAFKIRSEEKIYLVSRSNLLEQALVFALFFIALYIQSIPLSTYIFGTVHDTSLHSLFVQLILENGQIPVTHEPYLPAVVIVPQGAHAIFAFASIITGAVPPIAVFHVTNLFNAMVVLASYCFGKEFISNRWGGLSLALMITFVSMWPAFICWGLNTFVVGCVYFLITMTLIGRAEKIEEPSRNRRILILANIALFLGFLAAIHISLFVLLATTWLIERMIRSKSLTTAIRGLGEVIFSVSTSIILILPFIYRFLQYYHLPGNNIGLPEDILSIEGSPLPIIDPTAGLGSMVESILNLFYNYNISPHDPTRFIFIIMSVVICAYLVISVLKKRRLSDSEGILMILIGVSYLFIFLGIFFPLTQLFFPTFRFYIALLLSLSLLFGAVNIRIYDRLKALIMNIKKNSSSKKMGGIALLLIIFATLYAPFFYYRVVEDPQWITYNYGLYAVTTKDDYDLMVWMRDNIPRNANILINPFEPGLFIPSISQKRVVYPFSAYQLSFSYVNIVKLLSINEMNSTVFDYLQTNGITHVYVGSKNSKQSFEDSQDTKWDPYLFLGNPNFNLTKRVGEAYLFEFSLEDEHTILQDSFEYNDAFEGGWRVYHSYFGVFNWDIVQKYPYQGNNTVRIQARSQGSPAWISIFRKVYIPESSNVSLSVYLKPEKGFGPQDSLMLIVSDVSYINNIYLYYMKGDSLLSQKEGYFEFNLSELWEEINDEPLPRTIFVQLDNYDFDGIANVAYMDYLQIRIE